MLTASKPVTTSGHPTTERDVFQCLRRRYTNIRPGTNADQYVRAEHVRLPFPYGYGVASHIADYLVVDTYGKQPAIHGFEVKVTRSDWLRELKHPDKSAPWRQYCDYWWLVVADRHIERDDLPDDWGLLVPTAAGSLRASPSAPRNTAVKPMPGTVFAQLARAIAQTAGRETREGLL